MQHKKVSATKPQVRLPYPLLALSLFLRTPLLGGVNRTLQTTNWHLPKLISCCRDHAILRILFLKFWKSIFLITFISLIKHTLDVRGTIILESSQSWTQHLYDDLSNLHVAVILGEFQVETYLSECDTPIQALYIYTQMMTCKWAHAVTRTESQSWDSTFSPRKPSTKSSSVTDANYHRRPIIAGDPTPDRSIESAKGHDCLLSVFFW